MCGKWEMFETELTSEEDEQESDENVTPNICELFQADHIPTDSDENCFKYWYK